MEASNSKTVSRREFLSWLAMGGSLAVSYGVLAVYGGVFLYPQKKDSERELFVALTDQILPDKPITWTAPNGQDVIINYTKGKLLALSNVCPHLGCKVHWDSVNENFFCPCHSGVFDAKGNPVSGPPKKEDLKLKTYELSVDNKAVSIKWGQS